MALSLASDLSHAAAPEHQLRATLLASRVATTMGLGADDARDAFDATLLRWLGCTGTAPTLASWMGDEIAAHQRATGFASQLDPLLDILRHAGSGRSLGARVATVAGALRAGPAAIFGAACDSSTHLAARMGYGPGVVAALGVAFERWDGKGWPGRLRGEGVPVAAQVAMVADEAELLAASLRVDEARVAIGARAGRHDPALVAVVMDVADDWLAERASPELWSVVRDLDPDPTRVVADEDVDSVLSACADYVDIKTPATVGHSRGVAALASDAARGLGLPAGDVDLVRHAGLVHDVGRVAISNAVWDRPGPLPSADRELVRLHPYHGERIFSRSPWLEPIAATAMLHHERLDGSGYHRGLRAAALPTPARLVAAADVYQACCEPRPYRPAHTPENARDELRREVTAGHLDADAVEAVLAAAGHRTRRVRRTWPAGLTTREVEVLRLLTTGLSNKQIAGRLVVSDRTVGHHVAHIYQKAGVTTRAGATLFALHHDLLAETSVE
jgi:HD-GYP domain-containing protein (c-di-GMP phosphodiesterase class II)